MLHTSEINVCLMKFFPHLWNTKKTHTYIFICFTFRAALIFPQLKFLCKYKSGHSLGEKLRHFHQASTCLYIQMKLCILYLYTSVCTLHVKCRCIHYTTTLLHSRERMRSSSKVLASIRVSKFVELSVVLSVMFFQH